MALGSLAFYAYLEFLSGKGVKDKRVKFVHGKVHKFQGMPTLYASYHPSPRNTNTGKLTARMLVSVLNRIKKDFD
jgi:uracil-DNA glycosylase